MTKNWNSVRAEIHKLYSIDDLPLVEVMRLVNAKFNFTASERAYRARLLKWGFTKYSTGATAIPKRQRIPRPTGGSAGSRPLASAALATTSAEVQVYQGAADGAASLPGFRDLSPSDFLHPDSSFDLSNPVGDGKAPLHHAVINKDVDRAQALLSSGAPVGTRDDVGNEALHYAVLSGMAGMVQLLLRFGADPDSKGQSGRTPLHTAASQSNLGIVKMLLAQGVDNSGKDDHGDTPLHLALSPPAMTLQARRVPAIIRELVEFGCELNSPNAIGMTPFLKLLAWPAEGTERTEPELFGYRESVLFFLERGGSVDMPFPSGLTPLQMFLVQCKENWSRLVEGVGGKVIYRFVEKGASLETATAAGDPLVVCLFRHCKPYSKAHHTSLVTLVCRHVDTDSDLGDGNTALHSLLDRIGDGASGVWGPMIEVLLRRGANPNRRNMAGETPLSILFRSSRTPTFAKTTLQLLLEHGAEVSQCLIVKAAGHFPDADSILRPLLGAYLRQLETTTAAQEKHSTPAEQQWWDDWTRAAKIGQWREAKQLMHLSTVLKVGTKLVVLAAAMLAEKLVQASRDRVREKQAEKDKEREFVAEILASCRSHGIPVEMEYFDYLIELCL